MPSIQTDVGRAFAAQEEAASRALSITTVKFAEVAFPDPANPPVPPAALTGLEAVPVHSAPVTQVGKIDPDNVAYSVFLDTTVGDFIITQVGYFADDGAGGLVLMMVSNIPPVYKRANGPDQTGNNYRHTDIRQYAGAAAAANVIMDAASWQQDVTALLAAKEDIADKGASNGYAALDAGGKLAQPVDAAKLTSGLLPAARFNDTAHGNRAGGPLHPSATGAVAGFMAAADKSKLDGMETGATADQTAAEILTAVKTVDGAASGLDADLLDGQQGSYYQNAGNLNAGILPAARFNDTTHGNRGGGSLHAAATTSVAGFMAAADKSKLNGIETGATADQTASEILTAVKTVDGAGSGLDADLLDGQQATVFQTRSEKAVANGYASLDAGGKLPTAQLPAIALPAGSVAQSHLKTASGQVSTASSTLVQLILPGGEYGFYPRIGVTGGAPPHILGEAQISTSQDLTSQAGLFFTNVSARAGSGQTNATVWQRYIQASPPYDLGDGEVSLFVFALLESDGTVRAVYTAPDPPWANNGPTDIRPHFQRDGKGWQRRARRQPRPRSTGKAALAAWLEAARTPEVEEIEVTPAFKNADMALLPHPFLGNDLAGRTVVLLDPVSPLVGDLAALHEAGESACTLLHENWLRIDNTALKRRCPPGVLPCAVTWRNTR